MPIGKKFAVNWFVRILTPMVLVTWAVTLGLFPVTAAVANSFVSDRIIVECGLGAVDEISLAECVALKLEQAEATLERAEDTWQNLLQETTEPQASDPQTDSDQVQSDTVIEASSTDESPTAANVIAIVNDSALRSGVSTRGSTVLNVDADRKPADPVEMFDTSVEIPERFGFLPALFRSYRDQQCAWQASMFGSDRTRLYYQACLAEMTQTRAQELLRYLSVQRSRASSGTSYRGYYVKTDSGALFQACDRRTDWWVTGAESVLSALDRRYLDIKAQSPGDTDLLYAELRGTLLDTPNDGPGADYNLTLSVRDIDLMRPVAETDCDYQDYTTQLLLSAHSSDTVETIDAATVEDFASSGFLYGYFNYWLAACSVTENSVCSAETEAEFASDGDWKLRVDRSLEGDWRVMLVPTTDDQLIEKQLTIQINGTELFLDKSFPQPMRLPIRQGVEIADGELARELVAKLKLGREFRFQWFNEANVMSELKFSLIGVTRALQYFDSTKS